LTGAAQRLAEILERIQRAADSVGRDPETVTLIAVSKTHSVEQIQEFYDLGIRDFGESKLQESEPKIAALPADIRWHYIGKLQSNKVRRVLSGFQVVHTFENLRQLDAISSDFSPVRDVFIEVNVGKEAQKGGIAPENLASFHESLIECKRISFRGLMTIGPVQCDPEGMRPYYRELAQRNAELGGDWLSMGMSSDFDVAIQEGSTHVRVGTALFGARG